jgi:hypothetical protein
LWQEWPTAPANISARPPTTVIVCFMSHL